MGYLIRFIACYLTMEGILHYMYVIAIKDTRAWKGDTPAQIGMIGFWNLIIVWLKVDHPTSKALKTTDCLFSFYCLGAFSDYGLWQMESIHLKTWSDAWPTTIQLLVSGGAGIAVITFGLYGQSRHSLGKQTTDRWGEKGTFTSLLAEWRTSSSTVCLCSHLLLSGTILAFIYLHGAGLSACSLSQKWLLVTYCLHLV